MVLIVLHQVPLISQWVAKEIPNMLQEAKIWGYNAYCVISFKQLKGGRWWCWRAHKKILLE
jgi:hypothetical protein